MNKNWRLTSNNKNIVNEDHKKSPFLKCLLADSSVLLRLDTATGLPPPGPPGPDDFSLNPGLEPIL
jgi:hypothetical protein